MAALNFSPYSDPPHTSPQASTSYQPIGSIYGQSSILPVRDNGVSGSGRECCWRYDAEAAIAYAGPVGAAVFLVFELENDFVRFHCWQSALLCGVLLGVHLFLMLLGNTMQVLMLLVDLVVLGYMALRAYRDADLLDRYHLPYIGAIAQRWVEEE